MHNLRFLTLNFLKGASMGAADIVPGVSGGSIALITGIYERLLGSIKSFDGEALKLLFKRQWEALWKHIDGTFIISLIVGIAFSIFSLSKLISFLMSEHPIPLWSFFCGLIMIASVLILKDIKRWVPGVMLALVVGIGIAWWITGLPPTGSPDSLLFTFVAGAIAICAMILPGISGSFLLLILGQYERILQAVNDREVVVLGIFALGCVVGLLAFSRLVSWFLKNYHDLTIALLSGFMLGSINKLWPWKQVLSYRVNSKGIQQPFLTENVLPQNYLEMTGQESLILYAVIAFSFGILLVVSVDKLAKYIQPR